MDNDLPASRGFLAGTSGPALFGASVHGGSSHPVLLAAGGDDQKASGRTGTVLDVSGASPSSATRGEHMAFFEPAYKINVLRDRPFQQTA